MALGCLGRAEKLHEKQKRERRISLNFKLAKEVEKISSAPWGVPGGLGWIDT